jgi:biotin carboxylase
MNNKIRFRDLLAANGISPVKYRRVASHTDLEGWDHFPVIVKPADSQGCRGVFRANSMEQIEEGIDESIRLSKSGEAIVEEFLDGAELSVNTFALDGEVLFNEVSDRLVVPGSPKGIFPRGHGVPSEWCVGKDLIETKADVERTVKALGIENGPVYFQVRLTAKGPRILEATPRLDGCHVWRILKMVYGVDLLDACFKWLTGQQSAIDLRIRNNMGRHRKLFFLCPTGSTFRAADHELPKGAFLPEYYYQDGDTVLPIHGVMEKVVYYFEKG